MRLHLSMLALLGLLLSAPAAADLTIHYAPEPPSDRPLIIEADGQGRMRADLGAGQLIMMRDGDIFVVTVGEDHPNVVRLDDFLAVAAEFSVRVPGKPPDPWGIASGSLTGLKRAGPAP